MSEMERSFAAEDLNDEEVITRMLESGTPEELKKVSDFHKLDVERVELLSRYAKLRKQTLEQVWQQVKDRKNNNPIPTSAELDMGCYLEAIEPQVRAAVFNLQRKGYTSFESGFREFNKQRISFEKNHLENFKLPEKLIKELELKGVIVEVKLNSITLNCGRYLNLDELENVWNEVANILPDLQKPAEPCSVAAAKLFRQNF